MLLRSVQRYKFESNSQHRIRHRQSIRRCCDQYKDTNLKAIHNWWPLLLPKRFVVAISTKIQIWKQFTTGGRPLQRPQRLLRSVQRYKFESNSQPRCAKNNSTECCCDQYKDTNLKAIHNLSTTRTLITSVVAISTKIQIWKQFTTVAQYFVHRVRLLRSVQRYKFESNSQQQLKYNSRPPSCCDQYKDTNLKAIHNCSARICIAPLVVAISTKIQIWKQFTTHARGVRPYAMLLRSVQRYKFESNSQPMALLMASTVCCCDQYKDTNLKAIHNRRSTMFCWFFVVAISTKIQIWKQFTTGRHAEVVAHWLLRSVQRYKFESNSQLILLLLSVAPRCCDQYKDTNLKAIHNSGLVGCGDLHVVAISTKIQIWKQFTTVC